MPAPEADRLRNPGDPSVRGQVDPFVTDVMGAACGEGEEGLGLPALAPARHQYAGPAVQEGGGVQGEDAVAQRGHVDDGEQVRNVPDAPLADDVAPAADGLDRQPGPGGHAV